MYAYYVTASNGIIHAPQITLTLAEKSADRPVAFAEGLFHFSQLDNIIITYLLSACLNDKYKMFVHLQIKQMRALNSTNLIGNQSAVHPVDLLSTQMTCVESLLRAVVMS